MVSGHLFPHLFVNDGEAKPHGVDLVVIPVAGVPHACHAEHFVIVPALSVGQIAVGHDIFGRQYLADVVGIDEVQEALPEFLIDILLAVTGECLVKGEVDAFPDLVRILRIRAVADGVVGIYVDMVDTAVVRGHGGDHAVEFLAALFLGQDLLLQGQFFLLQGQFFLQLLLPDPALCLGLLDPGHLCDIHAHAQKAQPAGAVLEGQLGGLEVAHEAFGVRDILKKYIGLRHGGRLPVVLDEVVSRHRVKDIVVGQADNALRRGLVGILREGLVAGQVAAGRDILGKGHGRHVGQQGADGPHQVRHPSGCPRLLRQAQVVLLRPLVDLGEQENIGEHDADEETAGLEGIDGVHGDPVGIDKDSEGRDEREAQSCQQGPPVCLVFS